MHETYLYEDDGLITDEGGAGNDYVIYLSNLNGAWKVMSATINVDADLEDDEFNVNKKLGYKV